MLLGPTLAAAVTPAPPRGYVANRQKGGKLTLGQPWGDGCIHVKLKPGDDPQEAILRETRSRLGKLSGTIDGQLVTVRAKRAQVLDVLLHDELIDLGQPVTVKINGRRAFQGPVRRRVQTLLETAAEEWDFNRLFTVRVRIPAGKRGRQE